MALARPARRRAALPLRRALVGLPMGLPMTPDGVACPIVMALRGLPVPSVAPRLARSPVRAALACGYRGNNPPRATEWRYASGVSRLGHSMDDRASKSSLRKANG
jgi:hypothetical protein